MSEPHERVDAMLTSHVHKVPIVGGTGRVKIVTPTVKERKKEERQDERWSWLVDRRDRDGNRPRDAGFDPRTLHIPTEALKSMTAFQKQYWSIKKDNMDLVLFVRVGSFYELYDTDADVGLRIGLKLVGGVEHANFWKCGCRATSFQWWAKKCISLGYGVGRVEEVQSGSKVKNAAKVVERRLVQTYTPGTCPVTCWNDFQSREEDNEYEGGNSLIFCLYEDECSGLLGACMVNTTSAMIEVGEWQEVDNERSTLITTILEEHNPMEIVVASQKSLSIDTRRALSKFRPLVSNGIDGQSTLSFLRTGDDVSKAALAGWNDVRGRVVTLVRDLGGSCRDFMRMIDSQLQDHDVALRALAMCLYHLKATGCAYGILKRAVLEKMVQFSGTALSGSMILNATSLKNLEVHVGSLGTKDGSLYVFLSSKACTGMGRRCVRKWLSHPLTRLADIEARLDAVDALKQFNLHDLTDALRALPDVEKMMPHVAHQISLLNLDDENESLLLLSPGMKPQLARERIVYWHQIQSLCSVVHNLLYFVEPLQTFMDVLAEQNLEILPIFQKLFSSAMASKSVLLPISGSLPLPSAHLSKDDTVFLPEGIWQAIDEHMVSYRQAQYALKQHADLLTSMIAQNWSGPSRILKGVHLTGTGEATALECPRSLETHIRETIGWQSYERTRSGYLYRDEEIVRLSTAMEESKRAYNLGVNQAISVLANLFLDEYGTLLTFCQNIGELDALLSFSKVTREYGEELQFTRPRFSKSSYCSPCLEFKNVWNPQILSSHHILTQEHHEPSIVSNCVSLGGKSPSTLLISGANSGGKTTLLKTIAIATIMAQVGCYVPCSGSMIDPVNRIMTRLGARDRIQVGESTFAIEMKETSAILRQVDKHSLAIIDELGRGTSPREGEAIAWATLKALANSKSRTLFATHFHDLNQDFQSCPDLIARYHMKVPREHGSNVHDDSFRLFPGPMPENSSGGIICALNAGIPTDVIERASQISISMRELYSQRSKSIEVHFLRNAIDLLNSCVSSEVHASADHIMRLQSKIMDSLSAIYPLNS